MQEDFRPKHLDYLYFTKNKEWESEQEIRLIHFSNKTGKEYCSIEKSLVNIFLGVDFHIGYLPSLVMLCPHIHISKLYFHGVQLLPKEIYWGKESN